MTFGNRLPPTGTKPTMVRISPSTQEPKRRQVRRRKNSPSSRSSRPLISVSLLLVVLLAEYGSPIYGSMSDIVAAVFLGESKWTESMSRRHRLAASSCAAARSVGLAPSYRGQPGYYRKHDADNDGIACEPWP